MTETRLQFTPQARNTLPDRIALLGNPNCGKTALYNLLTGSRQKVANYSGVTVERKEGTANTPNNRSVAVLDLPGTYSLHASSPDEAVTRDVVTGQREVAPDLLVCVTDATNLRLNLQLVLQARELGLPMVVVLNMTDLLDKNGLQIDRERLAQELGVPVIDAVGIKNGGAQALLQMLDQPLPAAPAQAVRQQWQKVSQEEIIARQSEAQRIFKATVHSTRSNNLALTDKIDRITLHPLLGPLILAAVLFVMFQAVFTWAQVPSDAIKQGTEAVGAWVTEHMPEGVLRSLLVDGVVAGAGAVLVFLPQILILFFFILLLEDSGYLPRAAFLLDRIMGKVGLSGRSFIPLLSSFACAVPGIMSTRTIGNWRDRLITIMVAPLMTCSARLPVYALLIGAFIPEKTIGGIFNLQGLVLFTLYVAGIVSAMLVAWVSTRFRKGTAVAPLMMEMPAYRWPNLRNLLLGLYERAWIFIRRVGTIILAVTIVLWFLASYPTPPEGATQPDILYSFAGQLGMLLQKVFAPLGFNWQMSIALVPGMAAREVVVGALGTVYALSAKGEGLAEALSPVIGADWPLPVRCSTMRR